MNTGVKPSERIESVDALRGFDMLMIIFAADFFHNLQRSIPSPITTFLSSQFTHPKWYGFHFYDIIMPLFLFMVGAVIPFSLSKIRENNSDLKPVYFRLGRRFILLFVLGWIVEGNLLDFNPATFKIYCNTLQAIAMGYLFSSLAYLHLSQRGRFIFFVLCLIVYALILTVPNVPGFGRSVIRPEGNFANYFDEWLLGGLDTGNTYSYVLTSIGFTATTLSGLFAGEIIKSEISRPKVFRTLVIWGIGGFVLGLIWGIWHPIVKKIWTSSFVLFSSGICFLLMALFYWIIDVKGHRKWAFFLRVIGMNAITAYVLSHVIDFSAFSENIIYGFEQYLPVFYSVLTTLSGFGILYAFLWYMYRNNTFIKV